MTVNLVPDADDGYGETVPSKVPGSPTSSGGISKLTAQSKSIRAKNDAKWEALRERIHRIYIEEHNTLSATKDIIYREYAFVAGYV